MSLLRILGFAAWLVPPLRLGPLRLTPYGACAALGLMLGMFLTRPMALKNRIRPDQAWDAGMFALLACLFSSRLLLVIEHPKTFMHYPLLVLGLPSLTLGGLALAGFATVMFVQRQRIGLLTLLDVFAVPGAMLAVFLELGHQLDGTEIGMPSRLPWSVADPWTTGAERVQPVALFGALLSLLLAALLWFATVRIPRQQGRVAALGLLLGGLFAFVLAMLSLPAPAPVDLGVEPGQWVAIVAMLAGAGLWCFSRAPTISPLPVCGPEAPAASFLEIS